MWVATADIDAHFAAAEAEEKEATGYAMDDDVEGIGGGDTATKRRVGDGACEACPWIGV